MSNDTTSGEEYNWDDLWEIFAQLIKQPIEQHGQLILAAKINNAAMEKELRRLLQAHYSQSSILDTQPHWQANFNQVFQPPTDIHGYKIKRKLGSGGIGDVYLASKDEDGFVRKVAIKFATTGRFAKHVLNSFNTELKVLLALNHNNIERLFDGGITQDKVPFLIVEYIDGSHIDKYCNQNSLSLKQRLGLFQKICKAVDVVHRSLIVHRDIKAGNIMVGKDGEPKLLDFGLAKLTSRRARDDSETTYSSLMMTIAYASPEQINAATITTASDIYSLGILLHYLLTGQFPYQVSANNLSATIKTISEHVPNLASQNIKRNSVIEQLEPRLKKKLSGDVEQIIAKSIAKQPERRYLSATHFADDIQNYLDNRPVQAKQDSVFYRSRKFMQRHKFGVLASTMAVIALTTLLIIYYLQSNDLKQSIKDIKTEQQRVMQVTTFLKDIFKTSDPLVTDVKILKVKDLLDYSSKQLDSQFNQQPITKATLYETLGNVYLNMSQLPQAEELYLKAENLFTQENHQQGLLRIFIAKTRLYQQQGELKKVQTLLEQLVQQFPLAGLDLKRQAEIEVFQGQNNYLLGKYPQAQQLLLSALKKRVELYGEEHQLVVDIYQLLGNVYWRFGDFDQVQHYYQQSYNINKKILGESHHKTIKSRSSLGVLAYAQGNYDQALEHFKHVVKARFDRLGNTHLLTASAYNRLGATYYEAGIYDLAEKNLKQALSIFRNLKLENSMKYARALNNLGLVERQRQNYLQAQRSFLQAKVIEIENLGESHEDVASMNNNLGMVAADLGDPHAAIGLFKQTYQTLLDKHGMKNVNIAYSMTNIGRMYIHLGQITDAKQWIEEALELRLQKLGKNNIYYIETLAAHAEIAIKEQRFKQAKEELLQVIEIRKHNYPKEDWRIAEAQNIYAAINYQQKPQYYGEMFQCSYQVLGENLSADHYRLVAAQHRKTHFNIATVDKQEVDCVSQY
jgi:serine/threonine-protein kinase